MAKAPISVLVFCGARPGASPAYIAAAHEMGKVIAQNGWRLVYGAGDVGLMGEVARGAQDAGGDTFGVIPVHLLDMEVGKRDLTSFVVTETMHERKKVMFMNADVIALLPGGAGSLDEIFEVLTWRQIGLHEKSIYIVNTGGYWDQLIELLDHVVDQGFADASLKGYIRTVPDAAALAREVVASDL